MVLTSVNRDDLPDGGAAHYAACIRAIKQRKPGTAVEALTPDFQGVLRDVETVVDSGLEVFAQNVETVRRLTHPVRDPRAGYRADARGARRTPSGTGPEVLTKTSLMLGLGESEQEIARVHGRSARGGVDMLTLGQYLRPTVQSSGVQRFVAPEQFEQYRAWGLARGFRECVVRSAGALELSRRAGAGRQQRRPDSCGGRPGDAISRRFAAARLTSAGSAACAYEPTWRAMQRFTEERDAGHAR